jgi:hypothetical protein
MLSLWCTTAFEVLSVISGCGVGMNNILLFLVRGCLRGYFKNQNVERVTAGFTKKRIFKKLAGFKLATTAPSSKSIVCQQAKLLAVDPLYFRGARLWRCGCKIV